MSTIVELWDNVESRLSSIWEVSDQLLPTFISKAHDEGLVARTRKPRGSELDLPPVQTLAQIR